MNWTCIFSSSVHYRYPKYSGTMYIYILLKKQFYITLISIEFLKYWKIHSKQLMKAYIRHSQLKIPKQLIKYYLSLELNLHESLEGTDPNSYVQYPVCPQWVLTHASQHLCMLSTHPLMTYWEMLVHFWSSCYCSWSRVWGGFNSADSSSQFIPNIGVELAGQSSCSMSCCLTKTLTTWPQFALALSSWKMVTCGIWI